MSNTIIDTANDYKKLADMLGDAAQEAKIDVIDTGYIGDALLRLFYIKSLENKLESCQEQLTEQTDMDTYDAVFAASEAIQKVSDTAFEQIDSYVAQDKKFEMIIEDTSVNLESGNKDELLNQLYKCEGIIRMAESTANRYTIYGNTSSGWEHLDGMENEVEKTPEEKIYDELGINIYELMDIRQKIVLKLEDIVAKEGA